LAKALPICGKHKAVLASDTGLDPEAQPFQLCPDFQVETALATVDQDRDCRGGAKEMRDIHQGSFEGLKRVLSRDQADGVLSAAGTGIRLKHFDLLNGHYLSRSVPLWSGAGIC
jgi:hypothetical protein